MSVAPLNAVLGVHNKNGYCLHALVSLHSILSRAGSGIISHIFHDRTLGNNDKKNFCKLAAHFGNDIVFHDMEAYLERLPRLEAWKNFSQGCMFRLFIPCEIPGKPVLYLDSDTVATGNVLDILQPWLENDTMPLWAVNDSFAREAFMAPHLQSMGIKPENYFNSGVLLFHTGLVNANYADEIFNLAKNCENLVFPDQDILNMLLGKKNQIGAMPLKCNFQTGMGMRANMEQEKLGGRIVHYTWRKPWEKIFPAGMLYWREREKLSAII